MSEEPLFHCLTFGEWVKVTSVLSYSEVKILYYLLCQNPMGDRKIDCRIRTIAQVMSMSTGAVSRAIKQLESKGFIDEVEIIQAVINFKPRLISERAQKYLAKKSLESLPRRGVHSSEHEVHSSEHEVHSSEQVHNIDRARVKTSQINQTDPHSQDSGEREKNDLQNQLKEEPIHDSSEKLVEESVTQPINDSSKRSLAPRRDPFFNRKPSPKDIEWDWLPNGPWKTEDGKPDAHFLWAIAQRWVKEHGGDIHSKRANVLKHFRNDPTNLPIEWEWYQNPTLHKASNIQIRKQAGVDTTVDEQEIIKHFSAAKGLPEELRVTEEREPKEVLEEVAPHTLKAIEAPSDEFGQINPDSYQLKESSADDRAFWQKIYSPQLNQVTQSTDSSAKKEAEEAMDSVDDQKKVVKELIENLRRRHEEKRKRPLENQEEGDKNLTSMSKVINPPAEIPFSVILEDMRKYLNCGSDIYRQRAIDWACKPSNGCKLVRDSTGWIVDIEEIDF